MGLYVQKIFETSFLVAGFPIRGRATKLLLKAFPYFAKRGGLFPNTSKGGKTNVPLRYFVLGFGLFVFLGDFGQFGSPSFAPKKSSR